MYKVKKLDKQEIVQRLPELQSLYQNVYWTTNENEFKKGLVFVVFLRNRIVACARMVAINGYWCLRGCVVHPRHQGHNLQRKLIKIREKYARAKQGKTLSVWVTPNNLASLTNLLQEKFEYINRPWRLFDGVEHIGLYKKLS